MLKCIAQDENRNRLVRAGRYQYLTGQAAAIQMIENAVRGQLKEYKYAQSHGVNYTGNVFLGTPNYQLFESQVRTVVNAFSFVVSVDAFEYNVTYGENDNTVLNYDLTVQTIYGASAIDGTV